LTLQNQSLQQEVENSDEKVKIIQTENDQHCSLMASSNTKLKSQIAELEEKNNSLSETVIKQIEER
jgi:hypothetical protein